MSSKCHFCGNTNFKETTVKYTYSQNDKYLIVDNVPCKQCEYCGEQYFKAKVLKTIEREFNEVHLHGKVVRHEIRVPMEEFNEIAPA